jgi:aspartyl/asparaginyl beta-hydroxylase (cupin superfamily)
MAATTEDRLEMAQKAKAAREYTEARDLAGFTDNSDYDMWVLLERLRKLNLTERAAAERAAQPKSSGVTVSTGRINITPMGRDDF